MFRFSLYYQLFALGAIQIKLSKLSIMNKIIIIIRSCAQTMLSMYYDVCCGSTLSLFLLFKLKLPSWDINKAVDMTTCC